MLWDEPSLSAFRGFQIPRPVNRSSIPFHHRQTRRPKRGVDSRLESCQAVAMSHQAARAGNGAHTSEVHPSLRTAVLSCGNLSKPASRLRVWRLGGLCVVERGADEFRRQLGGTFSACLWICCVGRPGTTGLAHWVAAVAACRRARKKKPRPTRPPPAPTPPTFSSVPLSILQTEQTFVPDSLSPPCWVSTVVRRTGNLPGHVLESMPRCPV